MTFLLTTARTIHNDSNQAVVDAGVAFADPTDDNAIRRWMSTFSGYKQLRGGGDHVDSTRARKTQRHRYLRR